MNPKELIEWSQGHKCKTTNPRSTSERGKSPWRCTHCRSVDFDQIATGPVVEWFETWAKVGSDSGKYLDLMT
jgi:hypothetical protein